MDTGKKLHEILKSKAVPKTQRAFYVALEKLAGRLAYSDADYLANRYMHYFKKSIRKDKQPSVKRVCGFIEDLRYLAASKYVRMQKNQITWLMEDGNPIAEVNLIFSYMRSTPGVPKRLKRRFLEVDEFYQRY